MPLPVTTPSPGIFWCSMPKSSQLCSTYMSSLFERALVEQHVEPLARGQLALGMLRVDPLLPAAQQGSGAAAFHFGDIGGQMLPPLVVAGG